MLDARQVTQLAMAMPPRYSAFVMLATYASLRWGEITALARRDVDLDRGAVTVRRAFVERATGSLELGPPKSQASLRTVALPGPVTALMAAHLDAYVEPVPDALVFAGPTGVPLRRSNFNKLVGWTRAVAGLGVPQLQLHLHDLRHTCNTFAAGTRGTSTRDLMERMGHDTMRAALIYQHSTRDADRRIADAMSTQFDAHGGNSGTDTAAPVVELRARDGHAVPRPSRRGKDARHPNPWTLGLR